MHQEKKTVINMLKFIPSSKNIKVETNIQKERESEERQRNK